MILDFIFLVFLILLSAFFSSSETALTSFRRTRVKHLAEEGNANAQLIQNLIEQPSRFLSTILFGNTLVNVAIAILTGRIFSFFVSAKYSEIAATAAATIVLLVFGEIGPKSVAAERPESFSLIVARPISWLSKALYPVVNIFIHIAETFFVRATREGRRRPSPFFSADEIKTILSLSEEQGVIEEDERDMLHSIFEFGETVVREIMVPRTDMICLNAEATIDEALDTTLKYGFSRIPIFEENLDNVVGILYAKDILKKMKEKNGKIVPIKLARPPHFVPETKKVDDLLREMQKNKIHMAIVVDEYGGTAGLVTIEDIIEEIVGEIFDEYDTEKIMIEPIDENSYMVDASLPLDELNDLLEDVTLEGDNWDTVGGFVYSQIGKIPKPGEKVSYENVDFIVEKVLKQRITKIKIVKNSPQEEPAE